MRYQSVSIDSRQKVGKAKLPPKAQEQFANKLKTLQDFTDEHISSDSKKGIGYFILISMCSNH